MKDANLRVLVLNGYYDLATPFSATEYVMAHLGLPPGLGANRDEVLRGLSHDVRASAVDRENEARPRRIHRLNRAAMS